MNYTQFVYARSPLTGGLDLSLPPTPVEIDSGGTRNDFYIAFDW